MFVTDCRYLQPADMLPSSSPSLHLPFNALHPASASSSLLEIYFLHFFVFLLLASNLVSSFRNHITDM